MVRIPQAAAPTLFQLPVFQKLPARAVIELAKMFTQSFGLGATRRTHTAIARTHLVAQVGGVGTQFPFVHAVGRAKCAPPARDFNGAPAAESTAVGPCGQRTGSYPSALRRSLCAGRHVRLATRNRGFACLR